MVHYLAQLSYLCRRFTFDMAADDYNIIRCTSQIMGEWNTIAFNYARVEETNEEDERVHWSVNRVLIGSCSTK
jgi:hypothetical protein